MRIAIITRNANAWVYKLIWELGDPAISTTNELLIIDQIRPAGPPPWRSWAFVRRRGLIAFLDLWLQSVAARLADVKRAVPVNVKADETIHQFDRTNPAAYAKTLATMKARVEAGERKVEWWDTTAVNSKELIGRLREWNPEVVLLCAAPIIRKQFFREFPLVINPHCGIVPEFRGSSPLQWAVYLREFGKIGYTIHLATPEVDGGPVIEQQRIGLRSGWDITAIDWYLVYSMYTRLVELISAGRLNELAHAATPQVEGGGSWPPMGFVRTYLAGRRLRSFLGRREPSL